MQRPVVIVGAGIAGLTTALAAAPAPVWLLSRSLDGTGTASVLAQGGIAAAMAPGDRHGAHAKDTLTAGAWHNDASMVLWLCVQAPDAVEWLRRQGVRFDLAADGQLQLGREGGHDTARIVHANGDATGAEIIRALQAQVRAAPHVRWFDGVSVDALLLRGGRAAGIRMRDACGEQHDGEASAVVLATGGIGALFSRTSNPPGAVGAGLALGLAAGAAARDLEFVQFHPTALDVSGHSLPLVTEALRGAGAVLRDGELRPLMAGLHPLGDLAPRDIVARQVWQAHCCDGRVWLDATQVQGDWSARFPSVLRLCLAHGIDPRTQFIPVAPAAHFHMGGLAVDPDGQTSIPGLYAVGEVACNGVHGANRLASNSLLEAVACGRRLGARLADAGRRGHASGAYRWVERGAGLRDGLLPDLRALMWHAAGPVRKTSSLRIAWRTCRARVEEGWQLGLAARLLEAMLARRDSLGAHYRCEAQRGFHYSALPANHP